MKIVAKSIAITFVCLFVISIAGCAIVGRIVAFNHPKVKSRLDRYFPDRSITGKGRIEYATNGTNCLKVLFLSGDNHYSHGHHHGKMLGKEVEETFEAVLSGMERMFIPKEVRRFIPPYARRSIINGILDRAWKRMEKFTPIADMEEMRGLADGLKAAGINSITLQTIHRLHAIPDLTETSCSALVAFGKATKDGKAYQMRILDYGAEFSLYERPLITVYRPTADEKTYVNVGWIGFVGSVTGINENGVAVSEMGFGDPPRENLEGIPMPFLLKQVFRNAKSVPEALAIIRSARRNNSYVYLIGDPLEGAAAMLTTQEECRVFRVNEQTEVMIRNEHLIQFPDTLYAGHFQKKQEEIIREMHGMLDVSKIQEMARIIAMKSNLHTAIFDLSSRDLYVANRMGEKRAVDSPYVYFPGSRWMGGN